MTAAIRKPPIIRKALHPISDRKFLCSIMSTQDVQTRAGLGAKSGLSRRPGARLQTGRVTTKVPAPRAPNHTAAPARSSWRRRGGGLGRGVPPAHEPLQAVDEAGIDGVVQVHHRIDL